MTVALCEQRRRIWFQWPLLALLISLVAIGFSVHGFAEASQQPFDLLKFSGQPNTKVTTTGKGDKEIIELDRGGVVIQQRRTNGQIETLGIDNSGHGAVLCAQGIYVEIRSALDICYPGKYPELRADLDRGINSINTFIAVNSLVPTSKAQVDATMFADIAKERAVALKMTPVDLDKRCHSQEANEFIKPLLRSSKVDREKAFADLLSVPRPPVLNPCL